jgi:hypothetical protein
MVPPQIAVDNTVASNRQYEAVARYRLTIRHGPKVAHESFDDLDEAVTAMKRQTQVIRQEGPLEEISVIREYGPGQRVHARLELRSGGIFRRREAGMDLMGDGTLVPFVGVIRKEPIELEDGASPFDAVRTALA